MKLGTLLQTLHNKSHYKKLLCRIVHQKLDNLKEKGGWGEVEDGIWRINGDGRRLELGW